MDEDGCKERGESRVRSLNELNISTRKNEMKGMEKGN